MKRTWSASVWILLGLTLLGALLRFTDLGAQAFWADEELTDRLLGLGGFWSLAQRVSDAYESAPPTYFMLLWIWAAVFGGDEVGLRSFSALFGTLTIPMMYLAVRKLSNERGALIAAALCACSPILVWYSQEARVYSLYVFLVAACFWLFLRALEEPSAVRLISWGALGVLCFYSHYLAAIPVVVEAGLLLWLARDSRLAVLATIEGVTIAVLALLPYALDNRFTQSWISEIDFGTRVTQSFELFLVGNSDPVRVAVIGATAVALIGLGAVVAGGEWRERRAAGIALSVGLGGLAIMVVGYLVDADYLLGRNVLFAWVPLAAAISVGLGSPPLRTAGPLAAALLCGLGIWLVVEVKRDERLQRADFRAAAGLIGDPLPNGTRTVAASGAFLPTALRRYLPGIQGPLTSINPITPSRELVVVNYESPERGYLCWWGGACALPSFDVKLPPLPGWRLVERSSADGFVVTRFRSRRPRVPPLEYEPTVTLFQQVPPL